jgi:predicted NUDIX family NTP pyrophosphohydrolase
MKQSAGLLLFRKKNITVEYLLVHPGGPYFKNKNEGWWTIPKGEISEGEEPLDAALREFVEETGYSPTGPFINLSYITQKAGKKVFCWACEGDFDAQSFTCNTFTIEWPPKSGRFKEFPEVDNAGWFNREKAKEVINEKQFVFIEQLQTILETQGALK